EYERAAALATDNLAGLPSESVSEDFGLVCPPSIADRCTVILSLAELGRFADAAEPEAEAIRLATLSRGAFSIGWAHLAAGWVRLVRGEWERARLLIEHATTVLSKGNVVSLRSLSVGFSSWGLAQLDERIEVVSRLREGEQLLKGQAASGYIGDLGWGYLPLGRAALQAGQLDDAWRLACSAFEFSPRQPGFAAHAMHLLGEVATHPSRFDAGNGEAHYRRAFALAEELKMRPLIAHCHLGLGKLYQQTGAHERACEHLTAATTMYLDMDMAFWSEQAATRRHQQ
ncbi:MAG: tetratricopeptide repeat protein, partial [Solimonas sp.]